MLTTDWVFDFTALPRWDNRKRIPYVYDEYYDIPNSDMLCCIYSIAEVSMGSYLGFLAILKNKHAPTLFLNITEEFCFFNSVTASKDGRYLFLQPSIRNKEDGAIKRPILIIDIFENKFAFVSIDPLKSDYKIVESDRFNFRVETENHSMDAQPDVFCETKVRTDCLNWYDLYKLKSLPQMV